MNDVTTHRIPRKLVAEGLPPWRKRLRKIGNWVLYFCVGLCVIVMIGGQWIAPFDPYHSTPAEQLLGPSETYKLGTDHLGRDLFSRIVLGSQTVLWLSLIGVLISFAMGMILGITAGYFRGWFDQFVMTATDVMLGFPGLVLNIAILAVLGPGLFNTVLAITIPGWAEYSRMARALTLGEVHKEYMLTAKLNGTSSTRVLLRYVLPAILGQMLVYTLSGLGGFMLRFSGLAFIGLGVQPPTPELGLILSEAKDYMQLAPHYMFFPGVALVLIVVTANFLSDAARSRLDIDSQVGSEK